MNLLSNYNASSILYNSLSLTSLCVELFNITGATSPKHLRKLLSLSEDGDKRSKNMKLERVAKSMDLQKGYQSPPISPMKTGRQGRTRKQGIATAQATATNIAGLNKFGIVHDQRQGVTRRLSPQRSDSGYAGSEAGSSSSRSAEDARRRHTVGECFVREALSSNRTTVWN